MVNFEAAKKLAPTLITTSKQWLIDSLHNVATISHHAEAHALSDEEPNRNQQTASTEYLVYNWLESLFAWFQVIILWHEPLVSLYAISGLLTSFLLLTYFAPRFYATIMIAIFIYNLSKFWFRCVWPDIRVPPGADREAEMRLDVDRFTYLHPQLMTLAELGQHLENLIQSSEYYLSRMFQFRQQRPIAFCSYICLFLSFTAYIGNRVSGVSLLFWSITLTVTAPGIYYHLMPESFRNWLLNQSITIKNEIYNHYLQQKQVSTYIQAEESQDPIESTIEHDDKVESFASTIASTTKTQALSMFEQLRRTSFSLGKAVVGNGPVAATTSSHGNKNNQQQGFVLATAVPSPTIDVPRNQDQSKRQSRDELRQRRHIIQDENDEDSSTGSRSNSGVDGAGDKREEFGSNSSVSLIDSDDEQQDGLLDGFVLLER